MSVYVHCDKSSHGVTSNNMLEKLQKLIDDLAFFENVTINITKRPIVDSMPVGKYSSVPVGSGAIGSNYMYSTAPGANGPGPSYIYSVGVGGDSGAGSITSSYNYGSTTWADTPLDFTPLDYDSYLKKAEMTRDPGPVQGRLF